MSDTTHGLSERVLERAAAQCIKSLVYDREQLVRFVIKPALPILRPAIEAALIERLQMYADDAEIDDPGTLEQVPLVDWLARYLPTATEGADDHE